MQAEQATGNLLSIINEIHKCVRDHASPARFEKYIKKLRALKKINILIKFPKKDIIVGNSIRDISAIEYSLLHYFVITRNLNMVRELLSGENNANVLIKGSDGLSPLYCAVELSSEDIRYIPIIEELLKYSPEDQVVMQNNNGAIALHQAVRSQNLTIVRLLTSIQNTKQFLMTHGVSRATPLLLAVEKKVPQEIVEELLKFIPEQQIFISNKSGLLPIHWALNHGNKQIVIKLLQYKPLEQLQAKTSNGETPIVGAFASGNNDFVTWLFVEYPFLINTTAREGTTNLYDACNTKNLPLVRYLLNHGLAHQVITPNKQGLIPLTCACVYDLPDIAEELLKYEAEKQLAHREPQGYTAIATACSYGAVNTLRIISQCIINNKFDPKKYLLAKNDDDFIPLWIAIYNPNKIPNYPIDIMNILLQFITQEQLTLVNEDGHNALFFAVDKNRIAIVECFTHYLKSETYLTPTLKGVIPFYHAAQEGFVEIINILISKGPSEQLTISNNGWLPIHIALEKDQLKVVIRLCLVNKKVTEALTDDQLSPLHIAANFSSTLTFKYLINNKISRLSADSHGMLPIHYACQNPLLLFVEELLKENSEQQLFVRTNSGTTPLHHAVMAGEIEVINMLLKIVKDKSKLINMPDNQGLTVLHHACVRGNHEVVDILLKEGANLDLVDEKGWTTLHFATFKGHNKLQLILTEHSRKLLRVKNKFGSMPIHIAAEKGHLEIIKSMSTLDKSLISERDKFDRTPLFCATVFGHSAVVEYLAFNGADVNTSAAIDGQIITPLRIAVEQLDIVAVKILARAGVNVNQILDLTTGETIQDQINDLDEETAKIFKDILYPTRPTPTSQPEQTPTALLKKVQPDLNAEKQDRAVSGRNYLLSLGYTAEEMKAFDDAREEAKIKLKTNKMMMFISKQNVNTIIFSWCNGLFNSINDQLFHIVNPGSNNCFCFLDKTLLAAQGCPVEQLENTTFKFNNKSIKILDGDKAEYYEDVQIHGEIKNVRYSHELKINKVDRILLFELKSDNGDACLFIGARFIATGLHVNSQIRNVQKSSKASKKPLLITLPNSNNRISQEKLTPPITK